MTTTPEIKYKRLTRTTGRPGFSVASQSRGSLWLGPDHLLCVFSGGYTETYKRFYFRDIQAIIIRQSKRRLIWNAILGPFLLLSLGALATYLLNRDDVGIVLFVFFAVIILPPFVINNILGTACICYLRTAVQVEQLPSLHRLPKARRVLAQIQPLIAAAQGGELTPEAVAAQMTESIAPSPATPPGAAASEPAQPAPPVI